jgi:MFS family permease
MTFFQNGSFAVQVILTLGVVLAQIINIWTGRFQPWGWRVSLGLAGIPAIVLTLGGIFLPDTPNSLIERGFEEEGRKVCSLLLALA